MNGSPKTVLYVGTDPMRDPRLQRELAGMNPIWRISLAISGRETLELLKRESFDAVVVDDRLPDMPGLRLLDAIQQQHPGPHRLIVAELADPKAALKYAGVAHQCVPKPWNVEMLRGMLERTFTLALWLSNPSVRGLVNRMKVVPSPPDLYFAVVRALRSPEVDLDDLYDRAAQDPALTAKLLHVANSAALGLRHKVTNVGEAISYLGLETTRSLILLAHTFSYCDRSRASGFSIDRLWRHSFTTGVLARRIARQEKGSPEAVDECFLAGLLHDIGELLLAVNLPEEYGAVLAKKRSAQAEGTALPLWQAERDQFGATHAEVGAELMAIWNLPITVVEALALHHKPASLLNSGFSPLVAVHVADALERELAGANDLAEDNEIDVGYLENLGLDRRLEGWREACKHELQIATSARAV